MRDAGPANAPALVKVFSCRWRLETPRRAGSAEPGRELAAQLGHADTALDAADDAPVVDHQDRRPHVDVEPPGQVGLALHVDRGAPEGLVVLPFLHDLVDEGLDAAGRAGACRREVE